jgi:glycosyltransferase involved in cell wall biosynthesis
MRILYDYQAFLQRYGGVSRYFAEIIRALGDEAGVETLLPDFFSDNRYLSRKRTLLTARSFKGKVRIMDAANRRIARVALRGNFDLFHPTYFRTYFLESLGGRPFVVTVHDMIHEKFPGMVSDDGTRENKRLLCARASRIIAVSRNTRNDLCEVLGIPESKVSVIHHGTSISPVDGPAPHVRPYLLFVGERAEYKNFNFFLESAARFLREEGVDLLCAGGGRFATAERRLISGFGLDGRVVQVGITGEDVLALLYRHALLFCFPSLYEGFGLPIIEAFACGCPVAASSTSSFPEVAGEAAEYFDPRDRDSIDAALRHVVLDARRSAELAARGTERSLLYSWKNAAAETLRAYQAAVS